MARKKKQTFVDDGRTIANMNVPGMPWHLDGPKVSTDNGERQQEEHALAEIELTKGERRAMVKGAILAVLPIATIFAVAYLLIFLFIDFIWLS